jgi:pseudouridine synthase
MPKSERLQKILARAGLGSRRACEELIRQGRVTVDGRVAQLGQKADPERERIAVDDQAVQPLTNYTYIALYKPVGVVSTVRDPRGRTTVLDLIPVKTRLYPVGRLDMNSEGLILLTNDGELAQRLMHPRYEHTKEYQVCVDGHPSREVLERWRQGVMLDDRRTVQAGLSILRQEGSSTWLRVVLHEGRKRQIRRVAKSLGHPVRQLIRTRIGPLHMGKIQPGEWRHLNEGEIAELKKLKR